MNLNRTILTLLAWLMATTAQAQPELQWSRTFGGGDVDRCADIVQTPAGGFLLAGYDKSFGHFNEDGWLVWLDENGDSLTSREYGGDSWDFFFKVLPDEGGYYILGRFASFEGNLGWDSPWLVRLTENGDESWARTYRDENHGYVECDLELDPSGNLSMSGDAPHSNDFFLRKVNHEGRTIWEHTYDDRNRNERCYGHCLLDGGGYLVCGEVSVPADNDNPNGMLVMTDADGRLVWRHEYGGRAFEAFYDAVQLPDGDIAVIGSNDSKAWLLRINGEGEIITSHIYQNDHYAYFPRLTLLDDGGLMLLGNRDGACLIRTDADGEQLWALNPPRTESDAFPSVVQTADGGFAVGYSSRNNFAIAKYGADPAAGWPRWNALPAIEFREDESFDLTTESLAAHVEDTDNAAADLTYTIQAGAHVAVEPIEGGFRLTPEANWFGDDSVVVTVTDPDQHWAVAELRVNVRSVNDLPLPFSLLSPEDGYNLNANQIGFIWDAATQNYFEQDSIRYRLVMAVGDSQLVIPDLENTQFIFREVASLRELFGIGAGRGYTLIWWVEAEDCEGATESSERWTVWVNGFFEGVNPSAGLPARFCFVSASPNPFNSSLRLQYELAVPGEVRLQILDPQGRKTAELVSGFEIQGRHEVVWNAESFSPGLYFAVLETGLSNRAVIKVVLAK